MDPLPTPYDIAAIPGVPFTPSALLWLIVLGLLLIPFLIVAFSSRSTSRKPLALRSLTAQQLEKLAGGSTTKQTASEAALILKRFLAAHFGLAVEALSGEELARLGAGENSELARTLAPLFAELDQVRFAATAEPLRIKALIDRAVSSLAQKELQ